MLELFALVPNRGIRRRDINRALERVNDTALVFFFLGLLSQPAGAVDVWVARKNRYFHSKLPGCESFPPCKKLSEGATTKSEDKVVRPNNMR